MKWNSSTYFFSSPPFKSFQLNLENVYVTDRTDCKRNHKIDAKCICCFIRSFCISLVVFNPLTLDRTTVKRSRVKSRKRSRAFPRSEKNYFQLIPTDTELFWRPNTATKVSELITWFRRLHCQSTMLTSTEILPRRKNDRNSMKINFLRFSDLSLMG